MTLWGFCFFVCLFVFHFYGLECPKIVLSRPNKLAKSFRDDHSYVNCIKWHNIWSDVYSLSRSVSHVKWWATWFKISHARISNCFDFKQYIVKWLLCCLKLRTPHSHRGFRLISARDLHYRVNGYDLCSNLFSLSISPSPKFPLPLISTYFPRQPFVADTAIDMQPKD